MPNLAALVRDAPPGELDAVRRDIEILGNNSSSLATELAEETEKANIEQLRVVEVNGKLTVLSKYNKLPGGSSVFYTHGTQPHKFSVDHDTRQTTDKGSLDTEEIAVNSEITELQSQVNKYVGQHYASETVAAVFPYESKAVIVIIGRKLSPQNFHNGQLTAQYILDGKNLKGEIKADVHYFEEGNVRLKSVKQIDASVSVPSKLSVVLAKAESDFEEELNKTLVSLNEREFKGLRRQLPVTRQPMMWGKAVAGYKLGKELENR